MKKRITKEALEQLKYFIRFELDEEAAAYKNALAKLDEKFNDS